MIIRYATKPNRNGLQYQAEIDHENKTIKYGYFVFCGAPDVKASKEEIIHNILIPCEKNGYKKI